MKLDFIQPSVSITTEIPEVQKAIDEAESHMAAAQDYYEKALDAQGAGAPWQYLMQQTIVQQGAASLCQQQALMFLYGRIVFLLEPDEDEAEEPGPPEPLKEQIS